MGIKLTNKDSNEILSLTSDATGLEISEILSINREADNVEARTIIMVVLKYHNYTLMDMQSFLAKDHSTIIKNIKFHESDLLNNPEYKSKFTKVHNGFIDYKIKELNKLKM